MQEVLAGLDAVKDLAFFILRFFAKESWNDNLFVILNVVKDLNLFAPKILRKRGSEWQITAQCGRIPDQRDNAFVILNAVKDLALFTIKILRKRGSEWQIPAQNDRMPLSATEFVILNAVKDLVFFVLRFFAKEAQNDRVCGFVILRNEGSCFFHIEILRKRSSEWQGLWACHPERSEGSCFFHIKILRKRSSEWQTLRKMTRCWHRIATHLRIHLRMWF